MCSIGIFRLHCPMFACDVPEGQWPLGVRGAGWRGGGIDRLALREDWRPQHGLCVALPARKWAVRWPVSSDSCFVTFFSGRSGGPLGKQAELSD